jgi:Trypsin-co-occurring domain 1
VNRNAETLVMADLGGGRVIQVEARTTGDPARLTGDPEKAVGLLDKMRKGEPLSFDGVTNSIEAIADRVTAAFEHVKPDKASVEFGIDIGVESGGLTGLLAKGTGSATLKITLEWEAGAAGSSNG